MNDLLAKLAVVLLLAAFSAVAEDKVPLKRDLPKPLEVGTPAPLDGIPNLERTPEGKPPPDFMVPKGTINLAKSKKVTSSESDPAVGSLEYVTDGEKAGDEGNWVELGPGRQWCQIDLEKTSEIYAVIVWHYHAQKRVYRDVIVQVSDDPLFAKAVTTVFNNSTAGTDHPYVESYQGKLIDAKGIKGRYVRLYSNGSTSGKTNHYIEVEVWGKPAA